MNTNAFSADDTLITIARIYLTETDHDALHQLLNYLHDHAKVCGVTVFRGISGFGHSGRVHEASLLDLSLDMPIVVEFFDKPEPMQAILAHLKDTLEPGHLIDWSAFAQRPCHT